MLMFPFAVIAGTAGGHVAAAPGSFLRVVPLHTMAEPGVIFGIVAAIAGTLLIPSRRLIFVIFIPLIALVSFGISGILLDRVSLQMQPNGSAVGYAVALTLASLLGPNVIRNHNITLHSIGNCDRQNESRVEW